MFNEMLEFPGNTFGLAMNLERDSVGAVILGNYLHLSEGDTISFELATEKGREKAVNIKKE